MSDKNERLTNEQKELVAENHNLIYKYACKNKISLDDYYDILAIGLCKAAKSYDDNKNKFSTLAFKCMGNKFNSYKRKQMKQSVIPESLVISYDSTIKTIDGCDAPISDFIVDNGFDEGIFDDSMLIKFANSLSKNEKIIVDLLLDDMSQTDIAKIIGCKKQNVSYYVKKIREKAERFLL